MKRILSLTMAVLLLLGFLVGCNDEDEPPYVPQSLRGAHTATNTTPLEIDKIFDTPDRIVYIKKGQSVECTPDQVAAIMAVLEQMMAEVIAMQHSLLGDYVLETEVSKMKADSALRLCYDQRRKYTGREPHAVPVIRDGEPITINNDYDWDNFVYDEILTNCYDIILGRDGAYRDMKNSSGTQNMQMHLHFKDGPSHYFYLIDQIMNGEGNDT